jgi:hypothetical protein
VATRESHVKRIFGKSRSPDGGDPIDNTDLFADDGGAGR